MTTPLSTTGAYLITGGAGAVADAVGRVFAGAGARIALVGRDREALRPRADAIGAIALGADLTRLEDARRVVAETRQAFGRVDGLIHTAGAFEMTPAVAADAAAYDRMFDANMRTLFAATTAVLPVMLDQASGFIAGFSTGPIWTGAGGPGMALYAAAKAAVTAYLRSVEAEVRSRGIGVAIVYPIGVIDTARNRREMPGADPSGWIDPVEIATALLFACTRGPRGRLVELPIRSLA